MSLRDLVSEDMIGIMGDDDGGSLPCTITSPTGTSLPFNAFVNDISLLIDPLTGESVSGRKATIAPLITDLVAAGFQDIKGILDTDSLPWTVSFDDVADIISTFRVVDTSPDYQSNLNVMGLEVYTP